MKKAALIYNPFAGNQQFKNSIDSVRQRFQDGGIELELFETKHAGHGKELASACANRFGTVICAGGDGTVHEIANGLCSASAKPDFGIIPAGTANDFCRALAIPLDIEGACDTIINGNKRNIDVGSYRENDYFLNFWGIGLITDISKHVEIKNKTFLGRFAYFMSTVQNFNDTEPFSCRIEADEFKYEGEAVLIIVANGPSIGGIQLFFPEASLEDGLFNLLIVKSASITQLSSLVASKVSGEPIHHEDIINVKARRIKIETSPLQLIDCDGEKAHETPSTIQVLHQHLKVFVPELNP